MPHEHQGGWNKWELDFSQLVQTNNNEVLEAPHYGPFVGESDCDRYIHGLVRDCSNSNADAPKLLQSCTKPSIYPIHKNSNMKIDVHVVTSW